MHHFMLSLVVTSLLAQVLSSEQEELSKKWKKKLRSRTAEQQVLVKTALRHFSGVKKTTLL